MTEQRLIITENMMDSLYGSDNAKYDQHAKHLLASRKLLAEIVKKVVPEFQDASIDDIANKYIEGTPLVGSVPVAPGLTNAVPSKISGDRNEDVHRKKDTSPTTSSSTPAHREQENL